MRRGRAGAAATAARSAVAASARGHLQAGEPAAAAAAGAADAVLGVRPGRGHAGCRTPGPRGDQPVAGAVLQTRTGYRIPRHRRHPADRQLRFDARPADHRGGDVRRHPGPHAGTLRREGRGARFHHPRLEGRAKPGEMGAGRQAPQPRAAERPAPHHLQGG